MCEVLLHRHGSSEGLRALRAEAESPEKSSLQKALAQHLTFCQERWPVFDGLCKYILHCIDQLSLFPVQNWASGKSLNDPRDSVLRLAQFRSEISQSDRN